MIGTFIYSNGRWDSAPTSDLYLAIEVQNSDYAQVDYHLKHGRVGRVYLGIQPKDYFDNERASRDVDLPTHAQGISTWRKPFSTATLRSTTSRRYSRPPE